MEKQEVAVKGKRFSAMRDGREVGRAYLYILCNDLHQAPFGLLEDVFVEEQYRRQRIASDLLAAVLKCARENGCYKLLATSRDDGTRDPVHAWYRRSGFKAYGIEFRINL